MQITLEQFYAWIDEMREMYQREEDQAIRRRDMERATYAVAGKDACERLSNYVPMRRAMAENAVAINRRKS
jgi:hypothetical protein